MSEFEQDFCHAKWREGYEQGKFDGEWVGNQLKDADKIRCELNKEKVPQKRDDEGKDAVGDILVVLTIYCQQKGWSIAECFQLAYDEIKNRKGKMVNGSFVKEEDLA